LFFFWGAGSKFIIFGDFFAGKNYHFQLFFATKNKKFLFKAQKNADYFQLQRQMLYFRQFLPVKNEGIYCSERNPQK
jgi:hypothetical protein